MSTFPGQPMAGGPQPRPGGPMQFGAPPPSSVPADGGNDKKKGKKARKDKQPSTRGGGGSRLALVLGIVLALFAALLVLGTAAGSGDEDVSTRLVVVAAQDISPLTEVTPDLFTVAPVAQELLASLTPADGDVDADDATESPDDADQPPAPQVAAGQYIIVTSAEELETLEIFGSGRHVRYPIPAGAPLFADYLEDPDAARADLAPDERLVTIRASVGTTFAGRLAAGDHVDIIATDGAIASVVGIDAEIVAVDVSEGALQAAAERIAEPDDPEAGDLDREDVVPADPIPGLFTLRVRAQDLTRVAIVDAATTLVLAYRDPSATDLVAAAPAGVLDVLCDSPVTFNRAVEGQVLYFDADGTPIALSVPATPDAPGDIEVLDVPATHEVPHTTRLVPVVPLVDELGVHQRVTLPDGTTELLWQPTAETDGVIATGGEVIYDDEGTPTLRTLAEDAPLPVECADVITSLDPATADPAAPADDQADDAVIGSTDGGQ